jgi:hypothetical protein
VGVLIGAPRGGGLASQRKTNTVVQVPQQTLENCWTDGLVALECPDPLAALGAKEVSVKAAACRDLSKVGLPGVIPRLCELARSDKSPAVRLGSSAAVADILSRYRLGLARAGLPQAEREGLLRVLASVDPGVNAGMFPMLACLDIPEAGRRIRMGLRDPRADVRIGAGVGLLRLCQSASRGADEELEKEVVSLLRDKRLKADALAEVARTCAGAGYLSALPILESLELEGAHQEVINSLIAVLHGLPEEPRGCWVADGLDAGEVNPRPPRPPAFLLVGAGMAVMTREEEGWIPLPGFGKRAARRLFFRRPGATQAGPALQIGEHTFYPVEGGQLAETFDQFVSAHGWNGELTADAGASMAAEILGELVEAGDPNRRLFARCLLEAGDWEGAVRELEVVRSNKRAGFETSVLLGQIWESKGALALAKGAYEEAIERSKRKRDPGVVWARSRVETLSATMKENS